jgi:hypothetical protein
LYQRIEYLLGIHPQSLARFWSFAESLERHQLGQKQGLRGVGGSLNFVPHLQIAGA